MPPAAFQVTRCACFDVSFETLQACAVQEACGLEGLQDRFGCGRGCGLCVPYLRIMLRTGRTSIPLDAAEPRIDL